MVNNNLGNNSMVVDEEGHIEEVNHYYPFGGLMGDSYTANSNATSTTHSIHTTSFTQPYKYICKELDRTHGLDWYDHGARHYDPVTGRWNVMDAMAEKYYPLSPYASCGDNPVKLLDKNGKQVRPFGQAEYEMILGTLPKETRSYVVLNNRGFINVSILNQYKGDDYNTNVLKELVNNAMIVDVFLGKSFPWKIGSAYLNNNDVLNYPNPYLLGEITTENSLDPYKNVNDLSTKEWGSMGKTLFPDDYGAQNSTSNNIEVYINSDLSSEGRKESYSHEANGHVLLYFRSDNNHDKASHHYVGSTDINRTLCYLIMKTKIETIKNNEK